MPKWNKKSQYISSSKKNIKYKLNGIFNQNSSNYNLAGKFIKEDVFDVYPKQSFIKIEGAFGGDKVVYLRGKISEIQDNTMVNITITANYTFLVLAVIFSIAGLSMIIFIGLIKGIFFIIIGIFSYFQGIYIRNNFERRFAESMDLKLV